MDLFEEPVFSVSEFVDTVNNHLSLLGEVVVEGELSKVNVKDGRLVFTGLVDENSAVDVFSLTFKLHNLNQLEQGMLVRVRGESGLYKGSGRFRIFASEITPQGEGALQRAFEKLKAQLDEEGLFAKERKRPLPEWPEEIGLITAADSSAYHDVVKILTQRMSGLTIRHLPVNVQGQRAVQKLLQAFEYVHDHPNEFEVIILTRGGGSLEDLAAFNNERVCRAVFSCPVPVVSAVGHEDDWSLTDYVADMRASTPSNAAELVVYNADEVIAGMEQLMKLVFSRVHSMVRDEYHEISALERQILAPLIEKQQQVDHMLQLVRQLMAYFSYRIRDQQTQIEQIVTMLQSNLKHRLESTQQQIKHLDALVSSMDYRRVLKRGYSITRSSEGEIITSSQKLSTGDMMSTQFYDGDVHSKIIEEES